MVVAGSESAGHRLELDSLELDNLAQLRWPGG
jgi:hypothetical protein